jgi:hypothetical protein
MNHEYVCDRWLIYARGREPFAADGKHRELATRVVRCPRWDLATSGPDGTREVPAGYGAVR